VYIGIHPINFKAELVIFLLPRRLNFFFKENFSIFQKSAHEVVEEILRENPPMLKSKNQKTRSNSRSKRGELTPVFFAHKHTCLLIGTTRNFAK